MRSSSRRKALRSSRSSTRPLWRPSTRHSTGRTGTAPMASARRWTCSAGCGDGTRPLTLPAVQVERPRPRAGYVRVQRFYLYAERGLARQRVSVWLYDGRLSIAYQQTLLAQYTYRADRHAKRLRAVERPRLYRTAY